MVPRAAAGRAQKGEFNGQGQVTAIREGCGKVEPKKKKANENEDAKMSIQGQSRSRCCVSGTAQIFELSVAEERNQRSGQFAVLERFRFTVSGRPMLPTPTSTPASASDQVRQRSWKGVDDQQRHQLPAQLKHTISPSLACDGVHPNICNRGPIVREASLGSQRETSIRFSFFLTADTSSGSQGHLAELEPSESSYSIL